jgi:hypothetical protein
MIPAWEPTVLLVLVAIVLVDRALGRPQRLVVDGLVLLAGLLTAGVLDLPWGLVWLWVGTAAVAGDVVARLGAGRTCGTVRTVASSAGWCGVLLLAGRGVGNLGHPVLAALLGLVAIGSARPRHPVADTRSR